MTFTRFQTRLSNRRNSANSTGTLSNPHPQEGTLQETKLTEKANTYIYIPADGPVEETPGKDPSSCDSCECCYAGPREIKGLLTGGRWWQTPRHRAHARTGARGVSSPSRRNTETRDPLPENSGVIVHQVEDGSWPDAPPGAERVAWAPLQPPSEGGPLAAVNRWPLDRRRLWATRALAVKASRGCAIEEAERLAAEELARQGGAA